MSSEGRIPGILIGGPADSQQISVPADGPPPVDWLTVVPPVVGQFPPVPESSDSDGLSYAVYALNFIHRDNLGRIRGLLYEYAGRQGLPVVLEGRRRG